ncbi:Uncharacterised protein [Serratia fonticola]|uniref:Uncharacterized protein n=1 Tax=Serratia fonticola TaxID=47917 RepID=A0A4U9VMR6_SERFO|nr:Uncharacterised protein [Serratia fonticola]
MNNGVQYATNVDECADCCRFLKTPPISANVAVNIFNSFSSLIVGPKAQFAAVPQQKRQGC